MGMIRRNFAMPEELHQQLAAEAKRTSTSQSQIVREALEERLSWNTSGSRTLREQLQEHWNVALSLALGKPAGEATFEEIREALDR